MNHFNSHLFFEQKAYHSLPPQMDLLLVTWEFKTPENMGSIIRLAGNLGLSKIVMVGDGTLNLQSTKIQKVSRTALKFVTVQEAMTNDFQNFIPNDYRWVMLETTAQATNIYQTQLPDKLALFLGNEIEGLPQFLIDQCQQSVYIPLPGKVRSMNVSHAASVAAFEWYRQKTMQYTC